MRPTVRRCSCAFSSHTINATLYPALPFDPVADFTPITMLTTSPSLLIGHPAVPANSLAELVTLLQKNPGKYNFGIGAPGSSLHMAGERFKLDTGTFVGNIPYRGSAPALQDLIAGQVQLMFVSPAVGGAQLKAGKVKAFGTTATKRLAQFPEVPAIAEVVKGFESNAWFGLFGPARFRPMSRSACTRRRAARSRSPTCAGASRPRRSSRSAIRPRSSRASCRRTSGRWAKVVPLLRREARMSAPGRSEALIAPERAARRVVE